MQEIWNPSQVRLQHPRSLLGNVASEGKRKNPAPVGRVYASEVTRQNILKIFLPSSKTLRSLPEFIKYSELVRPEFESDKISSFAVQEITRELHAITVAARLRKTF